MPSWRAEALGQAGALEHPHQDMSPLGRRIWLPVPREGAGRGFTFLALAERWQDSIFLFLLLPGEFS